MERTMSRLRIFIKPIWRAMFVVVLAGAGWIAWSALADEAQAVERLLSREEARRLGLERAWFAQVQLDRSRHRVERAILTGDRLTVLTTAGVVQEVNALTGETVWTAPVGNANYPSLGPAANDKFVALINGSTLYVLRRQDGKPLLDRQVGGGPGAAPAVAAEYVFVPLISGRVEGYPLNQGDDKTHTPWYYQSHGRAMVSPLATPESIVWSTDQGNMYVGASLGPSVRFRLETPSDIVASPAYHNPLVYVATMHGDVFAVHEVNGERTWKYSTGYPIVRAPAAVGDRVYVTTEEPALHCVDAKTGDGLWVSPNVTQFAAASGKRVYGIDELGALVVLDAKTGALLDRMPTDGTANALVNDQTDRLYLMSDDGLLQCLHEIGARSRSITIRPRPSPPSRRRAPTAPPRIGYDRGSEPPAAAGEGAAPPTGEEVNPFGSQRRTARGRSRTAAAAWR